MAWLKKEPEPEGSPAATAAAQPSPEPERARERTMVDKVVNIGQSIHIKGELTGNEDITIEGRVEGKIILKDHNLTVGANGRIAAEIHAKAVLVVGEVVGNISADDKVEVAPTGSMKGDILAPRVVLADGARFKGSIDMERKGAQPMPGAGKSMMQDLRPVGAAKVAVGE
jgi:cytoskeletal protein CcmA (bactofilin family)